MRRAARNLEHYILRIGMREPNWRDLWTILYASQRWCRLQLPKHISPVLPTNKFGSFSIYTNIVEVCMSNYGNKTNWDILKAKQMYWQIDLKVKIKSHSSVKISPLFACLSLLPRWLLVGYTCLIGRHGCIRWIFKKKTANPLVYLLIKSNFPLEVGQMENFPPARFLDFPPVLPPSNLNSLISKLIQCLYILLFDRSKDHCSGCTTARSEIHRYLYCGCVYCLTPHLTHPCAVTIHKTCTDQRWNGYQDSAHIQDLRSMCCQHTKHFDLRQKGQ